MRSRDAVFLRFVPNVVPTIPIAISDLIMHFHDRDRDCDTEINLLPVYGYYLIVIFFYVSSAACSTNDTRVLLWCALSLGLFEIQPKIFARATRRTS